jgi:hypothetical protein
MARRAYPSYWRHGWLVLVVPAAVAIVVAESTPDLSTIEASTTISPGTYTAAIAPSVNHDMANRMAKEVAAVPGVSGARVRSDDSTLHFTLKGEAAVHVADIQKAVTRADPEAVMTLPVLEHSMAANPGL